MENGQCLPVILHSDMHAKLYPKGEFSCIQIEPWHTQTEITPYQYKPDGSFVLEFSQPKGWFTAYILSRSLVDSSLLSSITCLNRLTDSPLHVLESSSIS